MSAGLPPADDDMAKGGLDSPSIGLNEEAEEAEDFEESKESKEAKEAL